MTNYLSKKAVYWIVGVLVILLIANFAYTSITRSGKTKVDVLVIPKNATIYVDNKKVGSKNLYLKPGEHTFLASAENFQNDSVTLQVGEDSMDVGLLPEPNEDNNYFEENPRLQQQRETIGALKASQRGDAISKESPILDNLPISDVYGPFKIDYGIVDANTYRTFLTVSDSSPQGRYRALDWIRDQGQDPTDLEIRFPDFSNPLVQGVE